LAAGGRRTGLIGHRLGTASGDRLDLFGFGCSPSVPVPGGGGLRENSYLRRRATLRRHFV